ncbi:MAG: glycosyltransferase [Flavobacteriaceae bacterium]|nr:glycosyltransferase [Flavobacteriaceae bacterium]
MKKALIIQNKYIGDILVASIIAKNLKRTFPEMEVHFFCYDKGCIILENNPYIDKIISFNDNKLKEFSVLWSYAKKIRAEKYDILIDPYAKIQSRFITLISNAKQKISFDKPFFKYFYTQTFKVEKYPKFVQCTSIETRCLLLTPFVKNLQQIDFQTEIFLTDKEIAGSRKLMSDAGVTFTKPIIMVGVLGSSMNKSLPLAYMSELINCLQENYDVDILFNYVPNQQKEVDEILSKITQKEKIFTHILGSNVREFSAILKNCNVLIANEGGAINIAKALQIPTFSIFSPHKFRKDWGCYENLLIHKSFHLADINPEIYQQLDSKDFLKYPQKFYALMYPEKLIPKVENFVETVLKIEPKQTNKYIINNIRPKITALGITFNEEKNIGKFIQDVSFADEIIIVDSFSTDKTKEIASKYQNIKFLERKFDNFTNQKNFAIEQASYEWIIFFDPDERISNELRNEILLTVNSENPLDAYWVYRRFFLKNQHVKYSGWQNDKTVRLFKKSKCFYDSSKFVHERLISESKIGFLKNKLNHYSFNSVESYQKKLELYAKLKAEELFKKGKKPNFFHFYVKPAYRFFNQFILKLGILDGKSGFIISKMYADYVSSRYKYLKELWEK